MKRQNYGPRLGRLVFQLPRGVILAYDLRLTRTIPHYKDLSEDDKFGMGNIGPWTHVALRFPKKRRLGSQNGSGSSGLEKLLKIVSCAETEKLKETMVGPQVE